jgi:hypothetical protein
MVAEQKPGQEWPGFFVLWIWQGSEAVGFTACLLEG